jgi:D-alanine-D-alanine ligase
MKKSLDILVLTDVSVDPTNQDFEKEVKTEEIWQTEKDVLAALKSNGHTVRLVCIFNSIQPLIDAVNAQRPDLIFNLCEQFNDQPIYEKNIAACIELLGIPMTGTGPVGLTLCKNKGITQSLLAYHRIRVPQFAIFRRGDRIRRPARLKFPLFVKGLRIEGSVGIAKSSFVETDAELAERVEFFHTKMDQDALVEEFVDGRELYVSIMGNTRLRVFPFREITFGKMPPDAPRFATYKMKWDQEYRRHWNIRYTFAKDLPEDLARRITHISKRAYRILQLRGYGRMDLRVRPDGTVFVLEANPNPFLSSEEDFAESAKKTGLTFVQLIERIVRLARP